MNTIDIDIFEYAAKHKLRFNYKGSISTEDLYDLSLEALDSIYRELKKTLRESTSDSLLDEPTKVSCDLSVKIALIKHVVESKKRDAEARVIKNMNAEYKKRISNLIAQKEDEALNNLSIDELRAKLKELK